MAEICTTSSICKCSFGAAPAVLLGSATKTLSQSNPTAKITDIPKIPFGMCSSLANPAVASATAAALGVLTPQPCTPLIPAPWSPGVSTVMVEGTPALNSTSKCFCVYGGVIEITFSPAIYIKTP